MDKIEIFKGNLFEWGKQRILQEEAAGFPHSSKLFECDVFREALALQHLTQELRHRYLFWHWRGWLSRMGLAEPNEDETEKKEIRKVGDRICSWPIKSIVYCSLDGKRAKWVLTEQQREYSANGWIPAPHRGVRKYQHPPISDGKPWWPKSEIRKVLREQLPKVLGVRVQSDGPVWDYLLRRGGMHLYTNVDTGGAHVLRIEHIGIDLIQNGKKILDTRGLGMPLGSWLGYSIGGMDVPRAITIEQLMETIGYLSNTFVDGIMHSLEQADLKVD